MYTVNEAIRKAQPMNKIILADCDGVLLNWEYAFCTWMEQHGYTQIEKGNWEYDIAKRFSITKAEAKERVKIFNESAAIGFLPALRDAMFYVKRLHEEHGYTFHCITSLSLDPSAYQLRKMNLEKLFGPTAFTKLICLDTGAPKEAALEPYRDSNRYWIEDKLENAIVGQQMGLRPILVEHGFNMNEPLPKGMFKAVNWREIYQYITGETV